MFIYPNPASQQIFINASGKIERISITDVLGKTVFEKNENPTSINIQHLTNGIYFLKCYSEKGLFDFKFIKE